LEAKEAIPVVLPRKKRRNRAPEDLSISFLPDFPSCYRENFHEEAQAEVLLGFLNGVKKEEAMIPGDSQIIPTFRAEGALED
jgi:hypothetical protein